MDAPPWHNDPERIIDDSAIGLSCHIYGQAPVQADGRVGGKPFYFRSRHAAWTFTVCISHDIDAAAIYPQVEQPGFFQIDEYVGYFLSGEYGTGHGASSMRYDDAERIVRDCCRRFLGDSAENRETS